MRLSWEWTPELKLEKCRMHRNEAHEDCNLR